MTKKSKKSENKFTNRAFAAVFIFLISSLGLLLVVAFSQANLDNRSEAKESNKNYTSINKPSNRKNSQSIKLKEGWNIISFNVIPEDLSVESVFAELVNNEVLTLVKNKDGEVYWPEYQVNQIGDINIDEGYEINVVKNIVLKVDGFDVEIPNSIDLRKGWSIIAYSLNKPQKIKDIFASQIKNGSLIAVKDEDDNMFIQEDGQWIDNIDMMRSGEGYQVFMKEPSVLIYQ